MRRKYMLYLAILMALVACAKSEFLDKKPSSSILQPTTIREFQEILDNTTVMQYSGGLAQVSCDDYELSFADWQTGSATQRNAYLWAEDIYDGDQRIADWNGLYEQVFVCNVVLDAMVKHNLSETGDAQYTQGWALFNRAYALYDLTKNFCPAYDRLSADSDLGIPLRLSPNIDYLVDRSTLAACYDRILKDVKLAADLLPDLRPSDALNRPSRIAAYALLARIYLDMREYDEAELYAEKTLKLYSTLIDYNRVSVSSATPFSIFNEELMLNRSQNGLYSFTINFTISPAKVPQSIIDLYDSNDLRKQIYFARNATTGLYTKKRGYYGTGLYPFTGLATDEIYLIKAECLARKGEADLAMDWLNRLLVKRYVTNSFVARSAVDAIDALDQVLLERRKELIWRGLRWHDLKRLNREGANITLTRKLNGEIYTLPPNDPRYVFPIPDDEIALSGIVQNQRK